MEPTLEHERDRLLARGRYLTESRVWPMRTRIHPERWLSNFREDELPHALRLLESFIYCSPEMVNAMLTSTIQALTPHLQEPPLAANEVTAAWRAFVEQNVFTHVAGENPNSSDSGHTFVRKLRQEARVPEESLFYHPAALDRLRSSHTAVIFVDDFGGSGQQFIHTWHGRVTMPDGSETSFADVVDPSMAYYCPLVCTEYGLSEIQAACPGVNVRPAHLLPHQYGALHVESILWPEDLRPSARSFLDQVSNRAGIPEEAKYGFHELGLAIAFDHSVPDATLPIIYWEESGWNPLVQRT